jgi:hypothetical protein
MPFHHGARLHGFDIGRRILKATKVSASCKTASAVAPPCHDACRLRRIGVSFRADVALAHELERAIWKWGLRHPARQARLNVAPYKTEADMSLNRVVAGTAILLLLVTTADLEAQGFGVTAGAHANPDQFYGAGLYEFAPLTDRMTFRPTAEIGIGNGATLLAANGDFLYALPFWRRSSWRPYIGGGPALNYYRLELYSELEPGATVLAGLRHAPWFTELRVGFFDSPTMTLGVGYSFTRVNARNRGRRSR